MLQLIAAAEGAKSGAPATLRAAFRVGSVPNVRGTGTARQTRRAAGHWAGGVVPLQEEEVIQTIRLLTRFGEVGGDSNADTVRSCNRNSAQSTPIPRSILQQLLGSLAAQATTEQADNTPLLMKAAEHMAIRFALERFQKGEVKVNAVHQMMEHMSRQMDTLRQILKHAGRQDE